MSINQNNNSTISKRRFHWKDLRQPMRQCSFWLASAGLFFGGIGSAQVARTITNSSFETPVINNGCQGYVYAARVPGWQTSDPPLTSPTADFDSPNGCVGNNGTNPAGGTRVFEFYSNGVNDNQSRLVLNASDGRQFVELNAETASRLYQSMCLVAGETVGFTFSHLGRRSATTPDVAAFYVGGTSALGSGTRIVSASDTTRGTGTATAGLSTNTLSSQGGVSSTTGGITRYWYNYKGSFVVPSGMGGTQVISFEAVSSASGSTSQGNFLDAVQLTLNPFVEFVGSATSEMENGGGANLPQVRVVGVVPAGGLTIAVNVRAAGTTATTPSDYTGVTNITVPAGTYDGGSGSLFKIPLTVVNDNIAEPTEQIIFDLANGAGYTIANTMNCGGTATSSATYTILDDDISGRVYEDYNYGGGAGRAYNAGQGMSLRPNARVELYNSAGTFVNSTVTDANGFYSFGGVTAGNYTVRVVNSTVTSSRTGYLPGLLPVQTYAGGSKVGGEAPAKADAAAGASGTSLSSLTTTTMAPESIAAVTVGGSAAPSTDFGFNFDTIVNTNASGQGSLAQFISNSNALQNTGLAQAGSRSRDGVTEALPAGTETSIFMIPSGALTNGVAVINIPDGATLASSVLPAVTDPRTSIDGTTQTVNIGDTNAGLVGTGGSVGYLTTATLSQVPKPEVQLKGTGSGTTMTTAGYGLILNAQYSTLRGVSLLGFGGENDLQGLVFVKSADDSLIEQNFLGFAANANMCASTATPTGVGSGLWSQNSARGTLTHNIISCNGGNGAHIQSGTSAWTVTNNEIRANALNSSTLDGLNLSVGSNGNTVRGNLIIDNNANGTDTYNGGGNNLYESNTIKNNGKGGSGEIPGMRIYAKNNTIRYNLIQDNFGSGILVVNYSVTNSSDYLTGNLISKNSIFGNGTILSKNGGAPSNQIGIDLTVSTDSSASILSGTAPYVTPNDLGDVDVGGNNGFNFPVFDTAISDGTNAYLTGWARPGSIIELFIAAPDPGGFGEGQTYLVTLTEGSAADTDTTVSTYADRTVGTIGGLPTRTGTDNTNRFRFVVPLSALSGVGIGTSLTATATEAGTNNTSEFSPNILVTALTPNLGIVKTGPAFAKPSVVANSDPSVGPVTSASTSVVSYSLKVTTTNANATGTTTIKDTLPTGLSWTASGNYTAGPGTWTCSIVSQVITCTTTSTIAVGTPETITLNNMVVAAGTAAGTTLTNTATVSNPAETSSDVGSDNTSTATTKLILSELKKEVRVLPNTTFSTTASGLPTQTMEYCITTNNLGGADLANYVLSDTLNVNNTAVLSVPTTTDAAYGGKAIKWTRTTPNTAPATGSTTTSGNYTAALGDDAGTLTNSSLSVNLGTLLAGESVRSCFQVVIK